MLRRMFVGLVEGLVVGVALAIAAARGLGASAPGAFLTALLAALAGLVVGLVAGRPIWARDAKTEALLKAGVGAAIGAGSSFAIGRWLVMPLDLSAYSFGAGPAGKLAAVSLPLIACALALFFELDNTGDGKEQPRIQKRSHSRLEAAPSEASSDDDSEPFEDQPASRKHEKR